MHKELEPYRENIECRKCGAYDFYVQWIDEVVDGEIKQHLYYLCNKCQYSWRTETKDSKRKKINHICRCGWWAQQ